MQNVKTMPKQLPNPLGHLISPSFQLLAGELRYSVATSTSSPGWCAGDLTGAKQAKSSKVRRPKCLRRQSFEVPPSAWAWAKFVSSLAAFGTRSQNGWENVEDDFSRGGVPKFAELRWWLEQVSNKYSNIFYNLPWFVLSFHHRGEQGNISFNISKEPKWLQNLSCIFMKTCK